LPFPLPFNSMPYCLRYFVRVEFVILSCSQTNLFGFSLYNFSNSFFEIMIGMLNIKFNENKSENENLRAKLNQSRDYFFDIRVIEKFFVITALEVTL